jgi:hypothetical protein
MPTVLTLHNNESHVFDVPIRSIEVQIGKVRIAGQDHGPGDVYFSPDDRPAIKVVDLGNSSRFKYTAADEPLTGAPRPGSHTERHVRKLEGGAAA